MTVFFIYFYFLVGSDYAFSETNLNEVTRSIPSGPAGEYCVDVDILNDNIAESDMMFELYFITLPEGVQPGDVPESRVTITDAGGRFDRVLDRYV